MTIIKTITHKDVKAMRFQHRIERAAQAGRNALEHMPGWRKIDNRRHANAIALDLNQDVFAMLNFGVHEDKVSLHVEERRNMSNERLIATLNIGYHQSPEILAKKLKAFWDDNQGIAINRAAGITGRIQAREKLAKIVEEATKDGKHKAQRNSPDGWATLTETAYDYTRQIKTELSRRGNGEVEAKIEFKLDGDDVVRVLPLLRELLNG